MMVVLPVSIEAYLRETGFTSTEIILIRRLLADKSLTLREIASKTGKSTGVLDQALKKLIQKKIISKEGVNGQPKYSLLSLGALAEWVEQGCRGKLELEKKRHQNFQSFIASIGQEHQRPQMQHFEGREGVEKAYGMLLENPELLVYMPVSGSEEDDPMMPVRQALRRKRTARHVATRVLAPATSAGKRYRNRDVFESRETRLLTEQQCPILYEKVIAGDCVLYINHLESRACLMHYPELAHTERRMFEALWKEGKMDGVVVGSGQASSGKEPGANALAAPMVSVFASFWEQLMLMSVFWKICAACALLLFVYWFGLLVAHKTSVNYNYLSLFLYSLLPLVGGVFALTLLKAWGGFKTMVGKLVGCIGLGLLFFGCGSMVWSYYNFIVSIPVLYPSLADAAFILGVLSYGLSVIFIA